MGLLTKNTAEKPEVRSELDKELKRIMIDNSFLKKLVTDQIAQMPDDETTRRYMLYSIYVFDNPKVLRADVSYIEREKAAARKRRDSVSRLRDISILVIGLLGSAGLAWLLGILKAFFG
jgi:predicted metalloprotease